DFRRFRSLMILAPRPLPSHFPPPSPGVHFRQLLPIPAPLPRPQLRADQGRDLTANPKQLLPRAPHHDHRGAAPPALGRRLQQQQLQPQQRHFRFPIGQHFGPTRQLPLGQRPLVGAKNAFHPPAPAINLRRPPPAQAWPLQHVGPQPNVLLLPSPHPDQPQPQRRPVLLLRLLRPIPDQPFVEACQRPPLVGVQLRLARQPHQKPHLGFPQGGVQV